MRQLFRLLETGAGNCHIYIDETAESRNGIQIAINGKTQRPSVCNAIESILIHENWFKQYGTQLLKALQEENVEIIGDYIVCQEFPNAKQASEEDWYTEYLSLTVSIKIVSNVNDAIEHINKYGTKHSEAIITENQENATSFLTLCRCSSSLP